MLRYLGRYTHRVAISNHRLLAFDGERVTFRWKDYAHGNKQRKMTLAATEFLRRFTQHILPRGFVRIRQFGFLTNTRRSTLLALARKLLATTPKPPEACRTRHCQDFHLAVSSLQWRNADRTKSLRPATGFPVQASRQLVNHGKSRGPITCPRARTYSCALPRRGLPSTSHRSHADLFQRAPASSEAAKAAFPPRSPRSSTRAASLKTQKTQLAAP